MITTGKFVLRSLRFYWRNHLAVAAGAALATAIPVGALLGGDSVRYSLERLALLRLGKTKLAVTSPARFFRSALAEAVKSAIPQNVAPALVLRGVVASGDGKVRVNRVQVIGVDERFWALGESPSNPPKLVDGQAIINRRLARQLGFGSPRASPSHIVVRIGKPNWLPRDAPLSSDKDLAVAARVEGGGVASDEQRGGFRLQANQISPARGF